MKDNELTKRDGTLASPWQDAGIGHVTYPINTAASYGCLIVGAGITGLTAGLQLQKSGRKTVILEAHTAGFGTTGGTSAHINNFADTTYAEAKSAFGEEGAQLFADAIKEGFELIESNIDKYGISCEYEVKTGYLYAETEDEVKQLDEIAAGMQLVGVPAAVVKDVPTRVAYIAALQIPGQAQFHPVKYLNGLIKAYTDAGGVILENTPVEKLTHEDGGHIAHSGDKTISAEKVIYATHIPPGITVFSFRCAPYRSYVLGLTLKSGDYPDALIYDLQEPYHYVRTQIIDGEQLLLIGGSDHKTGHDDPEKAFSELEQYARRYYDVAGIKYKWSSQYYIPDDGFPYIGQIPFMADGILAATGFNGNGMMLGSVSGKILADLAISKENRYAKVFSPFRIKPIDGFSAFVHENADVAYHFIAERFGIPEADSLKKLAPGTGEVLEFNGKKLAVYRDEQGAIHALSPTCTHAGCVVSFNAAEKTWDCPCHGGRFNINGDVITGPPVNPLKKIETNNSYEKSI